MPLALCWVFYACHGTPVWLELRFGCAAEEKHVTAHHSPYLHRHPTSNKSLGISRQRWMDCRSGGEGSRIALGDDSDLKKKKSNMSKMSQAQWDNPKR